MHVHLYIHTHKTLFYVIKKFYFVIKRRRETIITERGSSIMRRSYVVIAAYSKQLSACLATTIAERPYLVARLH